MKKLSGRYAFVTAEERLFLTADRSRLVGPDDKDAAFLFCNPGQQIPAAEAERYGLLDKPEPEVKESAPAENKEAKPEETKGRIMQSESRRGK